MTAAQVITDKLMELGVKDEKQAIRWATEISIALDIGGWFTTDSDHLAMLRSMQRRLMQEINSDETKARDLAALTNRMQTLSREISTIEERQRQEKRQAGSKNGSTNTADSGKKSGKRSVRNSGSSGSFDPTKV